MMRQQHGLPTSCMFNFVLQPFCLPRRKVREVIRPYVVVEESSVDPNELPTLVAQTEEARLLSKLLDHLVVRNAPAVHVVIPREAKRPRPRGSHAAVRVESQT